MIPITFAVVMGATFGLGVWWLRRPRDTKDMVQVFAQPATINTTSWILVQRKSETCRYAALRGKFSVPGGHIKTSESARTAACREMKEETGIILRPGDLYYMGVYKSKVGGGDVFCYAAKLKINDMLILKSSDDEPVNPMSFAVLQGLSREDCTPDLQARADYAQALLLGDKLPRWVD